VAGGEDSEEPKSWAVRARASEGVRVGEN